MVCHFLTLTVQAIPSVNTVRINKHFLIQQLLYNDRIANQNLPYFTTQIP